MPKKTDKPVDFDFVSPSQSLAHSWPKDILLRKHGFVIHSRPKDGLDLWEKRGETYTVAEALEVIQAEEEV